MLFIGPKWKCFKYVIRRAALFSINVIIFFSSARSRHFILIKNYIDIIVLVLKRNKMIIPDNTNFVVFFSFYLFFYAIKIFYWILNLQYTQYFESPYWRKKIFTSREMTMSWKYHKQLQQVRGSKLFFFLKWKPTPEKILPVSHTCTTLKNLNTYNPPTKPHSPFPIYCIHSP